MNTTNGRWAKNYDCCSRCGRTSLKHAGFGFCTGCAVISYAERNPSAAARIKAAKDKWYRKFKRQGGLRLLKQVRETNHFDGMREAALKRDNYKCVRCGTGTALTVHHKDGRGRSVSREEKNNSLRNLETLCRACHMREHRGEITKAKRTRCEYWTPKWKLMACIDCGKSSAPHQREGYCNKCWWKERARRLAAGTLVVVPGRGYTGGKWKE